MLPWCRALSARPRRVACNRDPAEETYGPFADSCLPTDVHTGGKQETMWPEPDLWKAALLIRQDAAHWELRSISAGLIQRLSGVMASVPVCRARTRPASSRRSCSRGVLACLAQKGLWKGLSSTGGPGRGWYAGRDQPRTHARRQGVPAHSARPCVHAGSVQPETSATIDWGTMRLYNTVLLGVRTGSVPCFLGTARTASRAASTRSPSASRRRSFSRERRRAAALAALFSSFRSRNAFRAALARACAASSTCSRNAARSTH